MKKIHHRRTCPFLPPYLVYVFRAPSITHSLHLLLTVSPTHACRYLVYSMYSSSALHYRMHGTNETTNERKRTKISARAESNSVGGKWKTIQTLVKLRDGS
mmetsp:Transcript_5926/g.9102  ORF Transcript_5926/g.9102 Transcript_5926/m.9102 type:complete len:101 (-) Transcript_5926:1401-1703(-)